MLDAVLLPLEAHYRDPATVEIRMSRPGEVVVERRGQGKTRVPDEELTIAAVESICRPGDRRADVRHRRRRQRRIGQNLVHVDAGQERAFENAPQAVAFPVEHVGVLALVALAVLHPAGERRPHLALARKRQAEDVVEGDR